MNNLKIHEISDYHAFLEVVELEPLEGAKHGTLVFRTDGYQEGPAVVMSPKQVLELTRWLNAYLDRVDQNGSKS